jgi:uncharacterized membrane protein YcjF (UPF0283 family)
MWYISQISNETHNVEICRHSGERSTFQVPQEFQAHDKKLLYIASQMDVQEAQVNKTAAVPHKRYSQLLTITLVETAVLVALIIWRLV